MFLCENNHDLYVFIHLLANIFKYTPRQEIIDQTIANLATFLERFPEYVLADTKTYITGTNILENGQLNFTCTTGSYQILQSKLQTLIEYMQEYNGDNTKIQVIALDILDFMLP